MPTISWVNGVAVRMYYNDHAPPHLHAFIASDEARVDITTGELLSGRLPRSAQQALQVWTLAHQDALMQNWERARRQEPLERIPGYSNDD